MGKHMSICAFFNDDAGAVPIGWVGLADVVGGSGTRTNGDVSGGVTTLSPDTLDAMATDLDSASFFQSPTPDSPRPIISAVIGDPSGPSAGILPCARTDPNPTPRSSRCPIAPKGRTRLGAVTALVPLGVPGRHLDGPDLIPVHRSSNIELPRVFAMFKSFLSDETGAVTVDWVVLTATVMGLGMASYPAANTTCQGTSTPICAKTGSTPPGGLAQRLSRRGYSADRSCLLYATKAVHVHPRPCI